MTNPPGSNGEESTVSKGTVDRPIETSTLSQLKTARTSAKRSFTRVVNRIYSLIKNHENYERFQEDDSLLGTLLGLVREAHDEYASSLDVEAGQKETSWFSEIEVTAKQCRADMEIYFKRCLPTTTGTVDHSSKAKSSMASVIHQQTERTLNKLTEDLAKEQDEDRELQMLERQLKERRQQVQEQRALREKETRAERMNLS